MILDLPTFSFSLPSALATRLAQAFRSASLSEIPSPLLSLLLLASATWSLCSFS
jgi:hypothetical protein